MKKFTPIFSKVELKPYARCGSGDVDLMRSLKNVQFCVGFDIFPVVCLAPSRFLQLMQ